jgi:D-ribose pyranase
MKKGKLINSEISLAIARLGHTDSVVIADAGLPIPETNQRIDLALTKGIPTFIDTLRIILTEMYIEKAIVAEEMLEKSPDVLEQLKGLIGSAPIEVIPHVEFKMRTRSASVIVRTGEFTPYANVILISGAWGFDQ